MNVDIKVIQINQVNNYRLSAFPEERIKVLISELNVHYDKINNYNESGVTGEKINVEVIDSLTKLNEIIRLAPTYKINYEQNRGDFRFGVDLLESIIALLNTEVGHESTRNKLLELALNFLEDLYDYSIDSLINLSFLYRWLKKNDLVKNYSVRRSTYYPIRKNTDNHKIEFKPSDEEIDAFYESNKQKIYKYMAFEMADGRQERDPLSESKESNYYHYFKSLENIKI